MEKEIDRRDWGIYGAKWGKAVLGWEKPAVIWGDSVCFIFFRASSRLFGQFFLFCVFLQKHMRFLLPVVIFSFTDHPS